MAAQKPWLLSYRSSKYFIVAVVFCMIFTDIFLYGLIVPVVPGALETRVGVPADQTQSWASILLTVYGAALLVSAPLFGYLADHSRSRQLPLLLGLFILVGATVMLCVGTSVAIWIVGRVLQGSSAAMVWTVGLALLADTVEEGELGKYLGVVSLALTGGTVLGPLLGGLVYDHGGYYAVFAMAFALLGLDIVLRLVMVEKKIARKYELPENQQPSTSAPPPSEEKQESGAKDREAQVQALSPAKRRLPPLIWLLSSRRLLVALFAAMAFGIMITGFDAVLPLFVQQTFGWSSSGSGLIFIALFVPSLLSPWIGNMTDRYGPKFLATAGFLFSVPFYVLLRLVTHNSIEQKVLLCALLALIGLGITLVGTPIFTEIIHIVYAKERKNPGAFGTGGATAQAYGLFNLMFAAGTIIGPVYAGFIRDSAGWGTMGWTLGLLSAVTSVPVLLMTGGWIGSHRDGKLAATKSDRETDSEATEVTAT